MQTEINSFDSQQLPLMLRISGMIRRLNSLNEEQDALAGYIDLSLFEIIKKSFQRAEMNFNKLGLS